MNPNNPASDDCEHNHVIDISGDRSKLIGLCANCNEVVETACVWSTDAPSSPVAVPPVEAATVERNDMNPFGMDLRGSCCVDAMNVGDEGTLHTGGCPNRCSVVTKFDMPPGGYACALTVGHAGDHWIHPLYRTEAAPIPSSHTDGTAAPAVPEAVRLAAWNAWLAAMQTFDGNEGPALTAVIDAVWAAALSHVQAEADQSIVGSDHADGHLCMGDAGAYMCPCATEVPRG